MRTTASMPETNILSRTNRSFEARGFTLVELMVSLTIFSILMTVSVGTLLTLIDANAKAQALASAATNLSFALDSMTRDIRTGHSYYCPTAGGDHDGQNFPLPNDTSMPNDCGGSNPRDFIAFVRDRDGYKIGYRLKVENGRGKIEQKVDNESGGSVSNWTPITSSDTNITEFSVLVTDSETYDSVSGPQSRDRRQPMVQLTIKGSVQNGLENETDFSIQTNITQRRLDII